MLSTGIGYIPAAIIPLSLMQVITTVVLKSVTLTNANVRTTTVTHTEVINSKDAALTTLAISLTSAATKGMITNVLVLTSG